VFDWPLWVELGLSQPAVVCHSPRLRVCIGNRYVQNRVNNGGIALIGCAAVSASACEKYGLPNTTLAGTLSVETFFGPPGYGESPDTDAKERQAILHLAQPLCTVASDDAPAGQDQVKVTLVPMQPLDLRAFVGKAVAVRGSLFHAITGHHHTDVLITLDDLPLMLAPASSP
jgi:hypothetical protein